MIQQCDAYLLRFGELALKGRNQKRFVDDLLRIVRPRLKHLDAKIERAHQKVFIKTQAPPEQVKAALSTVFGITGISPVWRTKSDMTAILELAEQLTTPHKGSGKTFAVRARRPNKHFPVKSMEIQFQVADHLFSNGLDLPVNLKNPDLMLSINVDTRETTVWMEKWPALGGLPVSRHNCHGLLLSGGIDSPVAGHLIQKRGGSLACLYFHTPPYTVEAAKEKVLDLAEILSRYQNRLTLYIVNFTEAMKTIRAECDDAYTVVLSRRLMMRVATRIFQRDGIKSIITGESLGQVASQTIENITAIGEGVPLPILRPLIGMDKLEIIEISQRINAFETSIKPAQDCCSLFSPKEPVTKANMKVVHGEERKIDLDALEENAVALVETVTFRPDFSEPQG